MEAMVEEVVEQKEIVEEAPRSILERLHRLEQMVEAHSDAIADHSQDIDRLEEIVGI